MRAIFDEIAPLLISETKKTVSPSIAFFLESENSSHETPFCIRTTTQLWGTEIKIPPKMAAERWGKIINEE
jgi:hypothetical protein